MDSRTQENPGAGTALGVLLLMGAAAAGVFFYMRRESDSGPEAIFRAYLVKHASPDDLAALKTRVANVINSAEPIVDERGQPHIPEPGKSWLVEWNTAHQGGLALVWADGRVAMLND